MGTAAATRADKATRPARTQHGLTARRLGAKGLQELGQGHTVLELDGVVGHGGSSGVGDCLKTTPRVVHRMSLA